MKKVAFITLVFLLIVCFFFATGYAYGAKAPKAVFQETSFSFGQVKQGEVLSHKFTILNMGNAPLKIERVRPG